MAALLTKRGARTDRVSRVSPLQILEAGRPQMKDSSPRAAENSPGFDVAKSNFLAAMSHELRTPLNAIIGFAEILDAEVFGPMPVAQYSQYVRDILHSGRLLLQIVEDVLEISRAEAGELVLQRREIELQPLVEQICRSFDLQARARSIGIDADVSGDLVVQVDPEKFRRILACLLANAVKFSANGSTVRLTVELGSTGLLRICISDEGIGMNPEAIERAFSPFVQLDALLSRHFEGFGLGLSLARSLVQLHGGTLQLDSAPGEGTTAIIVLPAYANVSPRLTS